MPVNTKICNVYEFKYVHTYMLYTHTDVAISMFITYKSLTISSSHHSTHISCTVRINSTSDNDGMFSLGVTSVAVASITEEGTGTCIHTITHIQIYKYLYCIQIHMCM